MWYGMAMGNRALHQVLGSAKMWRAQRAMQIQMKEHIFNKGYLCLTRRPVLTAVPNTATSHPPIG